MSRLASSKTARFGPNGSSRANDPMLPSRKRTQGGASLCPGLSPFAPLGRTDREQARGQRPEARGNSQTAGKLWCDPQQVSKDYDACRLDSQEFSDHPKRADCPRVFLECFHLGAFFAPLHLCAFAFKQPCPVPVADAHRQ